MVVVEKLVEVKETEVVIEFKLEAKCRSDLHLWSLHPTVAVVFKVQTSAPHKFHVNPPNSILPPLSSTILQVILRPQPLPPTSFPRSPTELFLIKASLSASFEDADATHDTCLKVAYVGPFLLHHAASLGDTTAVRHLLCCQPSLLPHLPPADSSALLQSADPSLLPLLLNSGLHLSRRERRRRRRSPFECGSWPERCTIRSINQKGGSYMWEMGGGGQKGRWGRPTFRRGLWDQRRGREITGL